MMKPPVQKHLSTATVMQNPPVSGNCFRISLACGNLFQHARPGQFVTLHLPGNLTPLLRRPFSLHRVRFREEKAVGIDILYKVVGGFTEKLSRLSAGDKVDILGPLGNGFTILQNLSTAVLVGGGIGIAPLVFLAETLARTGIRPADSGICLGGRTGEDILCQDDFSAAGFPVRIATDDGSAGQQGLVTRVMADVIHIRRPDIIYACGPMPMLRAVADIARNHSIRCELSIETIMACGLGACLGCAVNKDDASGKYQHVCIDGPVFDAGKLKF